LNGSVRKSFEKPSRPN